MELEDDLPPEGGDIDAPDSGGEPDNPGSEDNGGEPSAPTFEDLAGDMGWRPKDQWRGDPEKWKPAHEFLRSTVDVNTRLSNRLKGVEETVTRMASTSATLTERAVAQERHRILQERKEAIELGDVAGVDAADEQLRSLPVIQQADAPPPETRDFVQRNAWFGQDQEATTWARNRAEELAKSGIGPTRQLAIVEREAKGLFPELFPEPEAKAKAKSAPLNQPGNRGGRPATKGFSAMPSDAQAAALDYEKRGICKRDDYAKAYFEQEGL